MHDLTLLRDLVLLVATALPMAALAHRLRAPTVVAFLLTGVAIGPHALGLIREPDSVSALAELGVVLLLFTIGLELSLSRVFRLGRAVVQGGGLQVLLTLGAVAGFARALGTPWRPAVLFGALAALSSTAIVLKVVKDRRELDTPHGRVMLAILLFQDLCVVPLMLLVPLLAGHGNGALQALGDVAVSIGVVAGLVLAGRFVVPWVLERVVGLRNREVFTLCIVFFGLGAAWLTAQFGLSLALGAFIAGLVVSESEFGLQALSDILPFRDTFSSIFFLSVGMLLDPAFVASRPWTVLAATVGLIVLKAAIAGGVTVSLGRPRAVGVRAGLGLAQTGEFSFVLAMVAVPTGLLDAAGHQLFIAVSVLSMFATPFIIAGSRTISQRLVGDAALNLPPEDAPELERLHDHVVIVGYGVNGRNLARVLRASGIPYVILEQNGQVVRHARRAGEPIHFGDGTSREVLHQLALERARVLVLAIASPDDERRGVAVARDMSRTLRIVVRTRYVAEIDELCRLGADSVVPEEFETSLEIFSRVLRLYGVPSNVIEREVRAARGEHYEMLRGLQLPELRFGELRGLGIGNVDTVLIEAGAPAVGEGAASLQLRQETGANLIAVVREGNASPNPAPDFTFRPGDTVVLVGDRESLERATALFRAAVPPERG
jgi:CPA2 family monovalent cation:H+ antiporter-2